MPTRCHSQVYLEGSCEYIHVRSKFLYYYIVYRSLCRMFEKHNVTVAMTELLGIDPDAKEVYIYMLVTMYNLL